MPRARVTTKPTPEAENAWINRELYRADRAHDLELRRRKGLGPRRHPSGALRPLLPEDRRLRVPWKRRPQSNEEARIDFESEVMCAAGGWF